MADLSSFSVFRGLDFLGIEIEPRNTRKLTETTETARIGHGYDQLQANRIRYFQIERLDGAHSRRMICEETDLLNSQVL